MTALDSLKEIAFSLSLSCLSFPMPAALQRWHRIFGFDKDKEGMDLVSLTSVRKSKYL